MKKIVHLLAMSLFAACFTKAAIAGALTGTVIDGAAHRPIEGALVTLNDRVVKTDNNGAFNISGNGDAIGFRAYGYTRQSVAASEFAGGPRAITLTPFKPNALYLSFYGIGSAKLREAAIDLADKTEINAVVIDVKGDRGGVAFKSSVPLTAKAGAQNLITIRDAKALLERLHGKHLYAVARIVVFKDDPLAAARPHLAVATARSSGIARNSHGQILRVVKSGTTISRSPSRPRELALMKFNSITSAFPVRHVFGSRKNQSRRIGLPRSPVFFPKRAGS